jgi:hypothetical protein
MLLDTRLVEPRGCIGTICVNGWQVLQRVYKYGGQPFVRDYLAKNHGTEFDRTFGPKTGKAMMHSFAGRLVTTRILSGYSG